MLVSRPQCLNMVRQLFCPTQTSLGRCWPVLLCILSMSLIFALAVPVSDHGPVLRQASLSAALIQKLARELRELQQRPEEGIRVNVAASTCADCHPASLLQAYS